ncbi:SRPBCC family protein [Streptomyces sp. NPDC048845]|uniref:SRPBCC family protein n=1 Tax=Streptomyces sp. NPDC048845 TaxID=3155390 RepID=UPI00341FBD8C
MRPVTVSTDVRQPPEQVYDFLDVMANHELFTRHYLTDWRYSGAPRGVGSCATVTAVLGGRKTDVVVEVVEAEAPRRIVERNTGVDGRRRGRGVYVVEPLPGGGSRVSFTYSWLAAPLADRLMASLVRTVMRRANRQAMRLLAAELAGRAAPAES